MEHVSAHPVQVLILAAALMASHVATAAGLVEPLLRYVPSRSHVEMLQSSGMASLQLGEFALAPKAKPTLDRSLSVRMAPVVSPVDGSFAAYLKDAVAVELTAAGKLDEEAPIVLSGQLTANALSGGLSVGSGKLGAQFTVSRQGSVVFEKELIVDVVWQSALDGYAAEREAKFQYANLHWRLLGKLFADPDFQRACRPSEAP
jgi:hypothetical protein